jgi:hypothetical protein
MVGIVVHHGASGAASVLGTRRHNGLRDEERRTTTMTVQRMDNVGIVVESLDAAISFFAELGLELEGRAAIEGDWAERVTGCTPCASRSP